MGENHSLSVIIPTRNRHDRLFKTLKSLAAQKFRPEEVIVVDASEDRTEPDRISRKFGASFEYFSAIHSARCGAAIQRNEGVASAQGELIGFCDDDIDFEPDCIALLRRFLAERPHFLGVAATVTNQAPRRLGRLTQFILKQLDDKRGAEFDGRVVGPALNIYPIFDPSGPLFRKTEWLNLGATIYRRGILPVPPFDSVFSGYSFCEDLALSCRVAQKGPLAVLRDARVFHDSYPGDHKCDGRAVARMEVRNRFYVATSILERPAVRSWFQLLLWYVFCAAANLRRLSFLSWLHQNAGAVQGLREILRAKHRVPEETDHD